MELPNTHVRVMAANPSGDDAINARHPNEAYIETLVDRFAGLSDCWPRGGSHVSKHFHE
jgi:hypothetical protein